MNRTLILSAIIAGCAIGFCAVEAIGLGVKGSAHDFTSYAWWPSEYLCLTCHSAQATFNHKLSTETYTVSNSPTLDATDLGQPGGTSAECLSCHDGTVPLDSFGSHEGSTRMTGSAVFGTDIRHHHPVSFTYNAALAVTDGQLHNPATTPSGLGGTITQDMLSDASKIECSTCHDQHGYSGLPSFLVKPIEGVVLCNTCHVGQSTADAHHIPGRQDPWNNCTMCHGGDLTGDMGPSCMACHNDFVPPLPPAPGHHAPNRDDPFGTGNCSLCHGADLTGDMGPSCYTCHDQVWPDPDFAPLADANGLTDTAPAAAEAPANLPPEVDASGPYTDVADRAVEISEDTEPPEADAWAVKIPYLSADSTVSFEKFGEVLFVRTTHTDGDVRFGLGAEFGKVIFWMDPTGAVFFGNIDRHAGTMRGIVFDYNGASSIWFAEPL